MINANELRIGNWVGGNFPNMIVKAIYEETIEVYMPGSEADFFDCELHELQPIPLTPEILEKAGFKKTPFDDTFCIKSFLYDLDSGNLFHDDESFVTELEIKHLHQLQNLIFALTGNEIEYKP